MPKYYLGLDLSLTSTGYAVVSVDDGIHTLETYGHVKTNSKECMGARLERIAFRIETLCEMFHFEVVIKERGFVGGGMTATQQLFKVQGAIEYALKKLGYCPIIDYAPTTIKKELTGNGKASKVEVASAVLSFFPGANFITDDESDATAVVLTHLMKEGII